ncbi:MAG: CdaR family protein [Eubacteriaceae bacterium]|nr:CdaR family protein [Eubacteriaceae bacterium]
MLKNKKYNLILSFIIAVCLWGYVIAETNPTIEVTYENIPIEFVQEEALEKYDLAVSSIDRETVNVTVKGSRNRINKLKTEDITAFVDLSEAVKGENQLKINIKTPNYIEYESSSAVKVEVYVEDLVSREIPVQVHYSGVDEDEEEPITLSVNFDTVTARGAKSIVDSVAYASATIDSKAVGKSPKEFDVELKAVDKSGKEVQHIELLMKEVKVSAETAKVKTVAIHADIINTDGDVQGRTYTVPEQVTVKGSAEALENLEYVESQPVDLTNVFTSKRLALTLKLPDGVEVVESEKNKLIVEVMVEEKGTRTFEYSDEDVSIIGLDDELTATLSNTVIKITVTGKTSIINGLGNDDFKLLVDLSRAKVGKRNVGITVECDKEYGNMEISPKVIGVQIEKKQSDSQVNEGNNQDDKEKDNSVND